MLEISNNESVGKRVRMEDLKSFKQLDQGSNNNRLKRWLLILLCIFIAILFLPWTQNIDSKGVVTSLNPEQRPQTIHSVIGGRIDKWFVKEGDFVKKGDTIIYITEVKDEYFDPNLLENVDQQIKSKESSVSSYMEKVRALDSQIDALIANKAVKLQQAENKLKQAYLKIKSDSIEYEAAKNNL
jgi:multidrug efflux pump subunit AcrA (membrane-fusion protein)